MNPSTLIFSLIIGSLCIMGMGGFFYTGAVSYGMVNITNYGIFNRSSELFTQINSNTNTLVNDTAIPGGDLGFYVLGAGTILVNFLKGEYLNIGFGMVTDLLGFTGLSIPLYFFTIVNTLLIIVIFFGVLRVLTGSGGGAL